MTPRPCPCGRPEPLDTCCGRYLGADAPAPPSAEALMRSRYTAFATGDAAVIRKTVGIVARARGMTRVANDAGMTREGVHKALAPDGDPKLSTVLRIFAALGVTLSATVEAPKPSQHPKLE